MRRVGLTFLLGVLAGTSASAAVATDIGSAAVDHARAECAEAFARHQALWPPEGAVIDVVWRTAPGRTDREAGSPAEVALSAWTMAQHGLADDIAPLVNFAERADAPPADWLPRYRKRAESLRASVDLYDCLRPSDDTLEALAGGTIPDDSVRVVASADCLARAGADFAAAFAGDGDSAAIHAAAQPALAAYETCQEGR